MKGGRGASTPSRRRKTKQPGASASKPSRRPTTVRLSAQRAEEILAYLEIFAALTHWTNDKKLTDQINYVRIQLGMRPICLVHLHNGVCETDELGACITDKGVVILREVGNRPGPREKQYEERHITK